MHKIPSLLEYKSLTSLDMPEVEVVLIEDPDPNCPFGAKEVGQGPLLPVMPAVANAIYDAVGVRIDEIPITPDKVLRALELKRRAKPRVGPDGFPAVPYPEPVVVLPPWEGGDGNAKARKPKLKVRRMMRCRGSSTARPRRSRRRRASSPAKARDAMLIAGGTDLLPNMKRRQKAPKVLVSLHRLPELRKLNGTFRRRAHAHARSSTARRPPTALRQAAHQVATVHLRNMGTLGGNLCLDTRCNYYNQNYEWRKAIDFCLKKDGDICWVATASKRCVAVSSTDCAPALMALGRR